MEEVALVYDNLNVHNIGSLFEAFPPRVALNLAARLQIRHTPKHGSWLNIAKPDLSLLSQQCLGHAIRSLELLAWKAQARSEQREASQTGVDWQFSTQDARIKLRHPCPHLQN